MMQSLRALPLYILTPSLIQHKACRAGEDGSDCTLNPTPHTHNRFRLYKSNEAKAQAHHVAITAVELASPCPTRRDTLVPIKCSGRLSLSRLEQDVSGACRSACPCLQLTEPCGM